MSLASFEMHFAFCLKWILAQLTLDIIGNRSLLFVSKPMSPQHDTDFDEYKYTCMSVYNSAKCALVL